jgi:hypothetical protein
MNNKTIKKKNNNNNASMHLNVPWPQREAFRDRLPFLGAPPVYAE